MVELRCLKCGWEWKYRGRKTVYATCPNCHRSVRIKGEEVGKKYIGDV